MAELPSIEVLIMPENADKFISRNPGTVSLIVGQDDQYWYLSSKNYPKIEKKVTPGNVKYIQNALSAIMPEYFMRKCTYFDEYAIISYVQDMRLGEHTPDYHNNKEIIEFKLFLVRFSELRVKMETAEVYQKYSRYNRKIRLIFCIISKEFFDEFQVAVDDQRMISYLQGQWMLNTGAKNPTYKYWDQELPSFNKVLQDLPWVFSENKPSLLKEGEDLLLLQDRYTSMDKLDDDVFELFDVAEDYVDYNMLDQKDFMDRISMKYKSVEHYKPNISWSSLWDRDANKEKYKTNFGHRATYLIDYPIFDSTEGAISTKEALDCINEFKNEKNDKILDFFSFYIRNSTEIDSISELNKNIAYLKTEFQSVSVEFLM